MSEQNYRTDEEWKKLIDGWKERLRNDKDWKQVHFDRCMADMWGRRSPEAKRLYEEEERRIAGGTLEPVAASDPVVPMDVEGDEGAADGNPAAAEEPVGAADEGAAAAEEPVDAADEVVAAAEEPVGAADEVEGVEEEPVDAADEVAGAAEEPVDAGKEVVGAAAETVDASGETVVAPVEPNRRSRRTGVTNIYEAFRQTDEEAGGYKEPGTLERARVVAQNKREAEAAAARRKEEKLEAEAAKKKARLEKKAAEEREKEARDYMRDEEEGDEEDAPCFKCDEPVSGHELQACTKCCELFCVRCRQHGAINPTVSVYVVRESTTDCQYHLDNICM